MSLKKRFQTWSQIALVGLGLLGGLKTTKTELGEGAEQDREKISMQIPVPDVKGQIDADMAQEDRERLEQLLDVMAQTPHGRQLIKILEKEKTRLCVVDAFEKDDEDFKTRGQTAGTSVINFSKTNLHSPSGLWTFAHEAAHVQQISNVTKFAQTLDDALTLNVLREALSERTAFLVVREAMENVPGFISQGDYETILNKRQYDFLDKQGLAVKSVEGDMLFDVRMKNVGSVQKRYEESSKGEVIDKTKFRTEPFWDEELKKEISKNILKINPNWDEVVRQMSGGEVKFVSQLPMPSWDFIGDMITRSYQNGNADVGKVDLSCVEQHTGDLLRGDDFKNAILFRMIDLLSHDLGVDWSSGTEMLKDMLPPDINSDDVDFKAFYAQQTNQGYLNKALNVLKNPELARLASQKDETTQEYLNSSDNPFKNMPELRALMLAESRDAAQSKLAETEFLFKTYQHVFFGKGNQRVVRRANPAANIHL